MNITSTAFQINEYIPQEYTCEGSNKNPPLTFSEIPEDTESLALIMEDPDAPSGTFTHWIIFNMSPATLQIMQSSLPITGMHGTNDFGDLGYGGPCPPNGTHRYFFKLYALKDMLPLDEGATKAAITTAMQSQVIETVELIGLYEKSKPA